MLFDPHKQIVKLQIGLVIGFVTTSPFVRQELELRSSFALLLVEIPMAIALHTIFVAEVIPAPRLGFHGGKN